MQAASTFHWLAKNGAALAVIISFGAFLISAFTLGWNIYRDVILKARLKVSFSLSQTVQPGSPPSKPFLCLSLVNLGPGIVVCDMAYLRKRPAWLGLFGVRTLATLMYDYFDPRSFKPPFKLEVAQRAQLTFPITSDCFLDGSILKIGIRDSFGRMHWAPKNDISRARSELKAFRAGLASQ
jgi:hypothetical protein